MKHSSVTESGAGVLLVIEGEPRPKGRPRFGKGRKPYTPKLTADWEELVASYTMDVFRKPCEGPLALTVTFYLGNDRRVDADNLVKALLDGMMPRAFKDDSQIVELHVSKRVDRVRPRAEVTVDLLENTSLEASETPMRRSA